MAAVILALIVFFHLAAFAIMPPGVGLVDPVAIIALPVMSVIFAAAIGLLQIAALGVLRLLRWRARS